MYDKITKFMSYVVVVCVILAALFGIGFMVVIGMRGATGAWLILILLLLAFFSYGMAFRFRMKRIRKQNEMRRAMEEEAAKNEAQEMEAAKDIKEE